MRARVCWLLVAALGVGSWSSAQDLPLPRRLPEEKKPSANDKEEKEKEKDMEEKEKDKENDEKKPNGKDASVGDAPQGIPIYYPLEPFPPPAPAVVDPRTGAWEQVHCAHYDMTYVPEVTRNGSAAPAPAAPRKPDVVPARLGTPVGNSPGGIQPVAWRPQVKRTLQLHKNPTTGAWEITNIPPPR